MRGVFRHKGALYSWARRFILRAAAQSHRARSLYSACAANTRRVLSASPPRTFVMTVGFPPVSPRTSGMGAVPSERRRNLIARSLYSASAANTCRVLFASPPRTFVMTVGFPLGKSLRIVSSCHRTRRSFMARVCHRTPAAEPAAPYILAVFRAYREADEIRRALILRSESAHTPPPAAVHTARDNPRRGSS